jgi:hypothetical protein
MSISGNSVAIRCIFGDQQDQTIGSKGKETPSGIKETSRLITQELFLLPEQHTNRKTSFVDSRYQRILKAMPLAPTNETRKVICINYFGGRNTLINNKYS